MLGNFGFDDDLRIVDSVESDSMDFSTLLQPADQGLTQSAEWTPEAHSAPDEPVFRVSKSRRWPAEPVTAKLKPGRKWTAEEDAKLTSLINRHQGNWRRISEEFPDKSSKQLKERWVNQLDPTVVDEPFTVEEDLCLIAKIREIGRSWSAIAKRMPGRSELMVKNRYHSFLRRRLEPEIFMSSTRISNLDAVVVRLAKGGRRCPNRLSELPLTTATIELSASRPSMPSII